MTGLRVVVVDNDAEALDLVCLDLELEGHEVVGRAMSGEGALSLVDRLAPDVLVVDHRMPPGLSGLEVAEALARRGSSVHVVLYSNYQSAELVEAARAAGASFVPKGNLRTLRRAVRADA